MAKSSYLLMFFLLLLNLLLHSTVHSTEERNNYQPLCPESFSCQNLGSLIFPFYNSSNPRCGLCELNCDEPIPKVKLGENGQSYDVLRVLLPGNLQVRDPNPRFDQSQLDSKRCDSIENLILPSSPSISYTISPNITLLRCTKNPERTHLIDEYFQEEREYYSYNKCNEHDFYYTYSGSISKSGNLPFHCSVMLLPGSSPSLLPSSTDPTDLFMLLKEDFTLGLQVSRDCLECHGNGGKCSNDNQKFQCSYIKREIHKENRRVLVIIKSALATIGGGAVIIIILLVFCFRRKLVVLVEFRIWRNKTENYLNVETFIKNHESLAPKRYSYSDVKKMTDSFKVKLGQGGYGSVYRGTLFKGNLVAVKVLTKSIGNGEELINELASISRTSHVNIVTRLGFCFEGHHRALIYEFMPNGSLEKFIYNQSSSTNGQLEWGKLYEIAIGIARGLEYLHRGCNTQILHFDIKPHNILLDQEFCPKISDFGLAKLCPGRRSVVSMSGMRGTPGYIAPEVFSRNFGGVSHKSDVYSYGMMVLEMVGGRNNLKVGVEHTSNINFPNWIYKRVQFNEDLGLHNIVNEEENERARKMIIVSLWCIQTDPSSRPSMTRVLDMLEGSLESLQVPPKPFLFSPSRSLNLRE